MKKALNLNNAFKVDFSSGAVRIFGYIFIGIFAICCLIPFVIIVSTSLSSEKEIMITGFGILPHGLTLFSYKLLFENSNMIIGSYTVTILITLVGTAIGLFLVSMTGYALQRPDFIARNHISFYIYFTTLFTGGLIPFYLLITKYLGLKDNYLAVLLPGLMTPWLIILMKNFIKSIPHSISESAKIDGAGDFKIFIRIVLPMSSSALATCGLFIALGFWNEWYNSMLFLTPNVEYRPLQLFLYNVISSAEFIKNSAAASNIKPIDMPTETMKMATAVVATGPVILFYPLVQKYFIKGITVGAVKG